MPASRPARPTILRTASAQSGALRSLTKVLVQILLSVCFGLASGLLRLYAAKTAAQSSGAVVAFPVSGLRLNCCFLIFSANWNAADRHGRRLESLESEHRPDALHYPAMILLDHVV
jgi:hypothetical protein